MWMCISCWELFVETFAVRWRRICGLDLIKCPNYASNALKSYTKFSSFPQSRSLSLSLMVAPKKWLLAVIGIGCICSHKKYHWRLSFFLFFIIRGTFSHYHLLFLILSLFYLIFHSFYVDLLNVHSKNDRVFQ